MSRQIFATEVSYECAPTFILEKFTNDDTIKGYITTLQNRYDEIFALSSNNSFVVYAVGERIDPLLNFFLQIPELFRYTYFYKTTEASANHLFAITSGLGTMLKGDGHILTQVREAHRAAVSMESIGVVLDQLVNKALHIGYRVRQETEIDKRSAAVVDTAFSVIYNEVQDIYDQRFLILGTGEIAQRALQCLKREGIHNVVITSSNAAAAHDLASQHNVSSVALAKAYPFFVHADVIIGEANVEDPSNPDLWTENFIKNMKSSDDDKKRVVLDFGLPRRISDKFRKESSVEMYTIDYLKTLQPAPLDLFSGIEEAWKIIGDEVADFIDVLHMLERAPVLTAYLSSMKYRSKKPSYHWAFLVPKFKSTFLKTEKSKRSSSLRNSRQNNLNALVTDKQINLKEDNLNGLLKFKSVKFNTSLN